MQLGKAFLLYGSNCIIPGGHTQRGSLYVHTYVPSGLFWRCPDEHRGSSLDLEPAAQNDEIGAIGLLRYPLSALLLKNFHAYPAARCCFCELRPLGSMIPLLTGALQVAVCPARSFSTSDVARSRVDAQWPRSGMQTHDAVRRSKINERQSDRSSVD